MACAGVRVSGCAKAANAAWGAIEDWELEAGYIE